MTTSARGAPPDAYSESSSSTNPWLIVEYIRGSDWGGGVGGLLYSIRSGIPSFTHCNSRGGVTTKTNTTGAVTWQAEYEAFGTHPNEVGATLDRQKANTKEEDPTGLLNEGFRYRDLETGEFITRDPIGFQEGPNLYAYVHQNPWTTFDPEGLEEEYRVNMSSDLDGGPHTYAPYNIVMKKIKKHGEVKLKEVAVPKPGFHPLDNEVSAHLRGNLHKEIVGYVVEHGVPVIQGPSDPAPGYFVSKVPLRDQTKAESDPTSYAKAETTNYIVQKGVGKKSVGKIGDYAVVHDLMNNTTGYAVIGDKGHPSGEEGSLALLHHLGATEASGNNDPEKVKGGRYIVRVYPNTRPKDNSFPAASQEGIDAAAGRLGMNTDFSAAQAHYDAQRAAKEAAHPHKKKKTKNK